jgi:hypothetical protein
MRRYILFGVLMLAAPAVSALTLEELEAARLAAAQRAAAAAGIDLSGGDPGSPGGATGQYAGCIGSAPGGMSLLGVQSDMGPSTQGVTPAAKLGRDHPAMKLLIEVGTEMGLYPDAEGASDADKARNAALRQRKALHDTYAEFLGYAEDGTMKGDLPMVELFAWVYEGKMEELARAYAEHHPLALKYASLHQAAEAAGSACP